MSRRNQTCLGSSDGELREAFRVGTGAALGGPADCRLLGQVDHKR
jgi:hypothetical protein